MLFTEQLHIEVQYTSTAIALLSYDNLLLYDVDPDYDDDADYDDG